MSLILLSIKIKNSINFKFLFMKIIKLLAFAILLLIVYSGNGYAQTGQKIFNFQGYATNPEGVALASLNIDVKFTIYPKTGTGYIYEETQNVVTDAYGAFQASVGSQDPSNLQRMNFTAVNTDYWMKVEFKRTADANFTTISDAALLAVPYAKYADNGVPVGTIISFGTGTTKIPEGWLLCDGTEYDGTDPKYAQLYAIIANTWGGTGTAFNVPELRGYFLRGQDITAGNDPDAATRTALIVGGNTGDNVGSYQTEAVGPHLHAVNLTTSSDGAHSHSMPAYRGADIKSAGSDWVLYNADGTSLGHTSVVFSGNHSHTVEGDTDDNTGSETRPKNAYVAYIIKY